MFVGVLKDFGADCLLIDQAVVPLGKCLFESLFSSPEEKMELSYLVIVNKRDFQDAYFVIFFLHSNQSTDEIY